MIKLTDILIILLTVTIYFLTSLWILFETDYPFLIIVVFLVFLTAHYFIKRQKKIMKYVQKDFGKLGYELLKERPLKFSEGTVKVKPEPIVNNLPISRYGYIRQFARVFTAKSKDGKIYELNTIVTKKWNGENHIEIKEKKTFANSG